MKIAGHAVQNRRIEISIIQPRGSVKNMKTTDTTLGANIRALREVRGKAVSEVSSHLEISPEQLLKYETGINRIPAALIYGIASYFKVPLEALFLISNGPNAVGTHQEDIESVKLYWSMGAEERMEVNRFIRDVWDRDASRANS
jgi:transcriptional regulator with XRE-family HTH domain